MYAEPQESDEVFPECDEDETSAVPASGGVFEVTLERVSSGVVSSFSVAPH